MGLFNKFKKKDDFFDQEATIKEYFALVPESKRRKCDTYEELYQEALLYVSKQNFDRNTQDQENYFHELTSDEYTIAILSGVLAYAVTLVVDSNGKGIEKAIDKVLPKDYDKDNPFDVKKGYGHRLFGHDPFTFGMKNIPADTVIRTKVDGIDQVVKIGEFLGVGTDGTVSMWDLIWKFYGNSDTKLRGVINCMKHIIVHFGKDLVTLSGLPVPFTTLLNKFSELGNGEAHYINYKDSVTKQLDRLHINVRASDFVSLVLIESLISVYGLTKDYGDKKPEFIKDMKLIAMGTCLSLQMATIVFSEVADFDSKKKIPGANVNLILAGAYFKFFIQEATSISKIRKEINERYDSEGY